MKENKEAKQEIKIKTEVIRYTQMIFRAKKYPETIYDKEPPKMSLNQFYVGHACPASNGIYPKEQFFSQEVLH